MRCWLERGTSAAEHSVKGWRPGVFWQQNQRLLDRCELWLGKLAQRRTREVDGHWPYWGCAKYLTGEALLHRCKAANCNRPSCLAVNEGNAGNDVQDCPLGGAKAAGIQSGTTDALIG